LGRPERDSSKKDIRNKKYEPHKKCMGQLTGRRHRNKGQKSKAKRGINRQQAKKKKNDDRLAEKGLPQADAALCTMCSGRKKKKGRSTPIKAKPTPCPRKKRTPWQSAVRQARSGYRREAQLVGEEEALLDWSKTPKGGSPWKVQGGIKNAGGRGEKGFLPSGWEAQEKDEAPA